MVGPTKRKPRRLSSPARGQPTPGSSLRSVCVGPCAGWRCRSGRKDQISSESDSPDSPSRSAARPLLDRGLDLGAIANDPRVRQQPLHVPLAEGRDRADLEAGGRPPGTPRACEGSSATRGRTGTPPGRGARTSPDRRGQGGPIRRRGNRRTRARRSPTSSAGVRRPHGLSESPPASAQQPSSAASGPAARRASARSAKGRQRTIRPSRRVNSAATSFSSATSSPSSQRHCWRSSAST